MVSGRSIALKFGEHFRSLGLIRRGHFRHWLRFFGNTTRPLRMVLPATRKGLAGNAMSPGKFGDKLETCEQIKDLAAMRHYEGWQQDCTTMLDLL